MRSDKIKKGITAAPQRALLHALGVTEKELEKPFIVPFINVIPNELKAVFREEIIKLMLERILQSDGTCFETFRRIHVKAIK